MERRAGTARYTGIMTNKGLAYLIWRDGQAFLKSKSAEIPATEADVARIKVRQTSPRPEFAHLIWPTLIV